MKSSSTNHTKLYSFVKLEIACGTCFASPQLATPSQPVQSTNSLSAAAVSFIRTPAPLDPVSLVRQICEDAYSGASRQRSRYVKRLTPVSCVRKTLGNGLEQLCEEVLKPVFADGTVAKKVWRAEPEQRLHFRADVGKFAIRPNVRNNEQLNRDVVIKTVADAVGQLSSAHSVDLKNYDCLILVEVYRVRCPPRQESRYILRCLADRSGIVECVRHERRWQGLREAKAL
jgi:hypothetical protein